MVGTRRGFWCLGVDPVLDRSLHFTALVVAAPFGAAVLVIMASYSTLTCRVIPLPSSISQRCVPSLLVSLTASSFSIFPLTLSLSLILAVACTSRFFSSCLVLAYIRRCLEWVNMSSDRGVEKGSLHGRPALSSLQTLSRRLTPRARIGEVMHWQYRACHNCVCPQFIDRDRVCRVVNFE